MAFLQFFWRWILRPFFVFVSIKAIYQIGLAFGFRPDDWLANTVLGVSSEAWSNVIGWVLIVLISASILWFFEWRRKSAPNISLKSPKYKQPEEPESSNAAVEPLPLMPLVELLKEAEKQGWQFTAYNSQQIFHFVDSLRDEGSTTTIHFWGRKVQRINNMTKEQTLTEIPSHLWQKAVISGMSCLDVSDELDNAITRDNFQTTVASDTRQDHLYKDIHLDRKQALRWLQHQIPSTTPEPPSLEEQQMNWKPSAKCIRKLKEWIPENPFVEITRHDKHSFVPARRLENAFKEAGWGNVHFDRDVWDTGSPHYKVGIEIQGASRTLVEGIITVLEEDGLPEITDNVDENYFKERGRLRIRVGIQ